MTNDFINKLSIKEIYSFDDLKMDTSIRAFKFNNIKEFDNDLFQKLSIEISKHMLQTKSNNNDENDPFVGALLVSKQANNKYSCVGCTRSAFHNGDHAEYTLLKTILNSTSLDGQILYATLEPCTKESRSKWKESCSEIISNKRIAKVYVGILDPNPYVSGNGIKFLLENGIDIEFFSKTNRNYLSVINNKFISQFKNGVEQRINRKIEASISNYISDKTIIEFMKEYYKCNSVNVEESSPKDLIFKFNQLMIQNKSIIEGGSLMPYEVINEFAMFFFNKPFHVVDCATLRFEFKNLIESGEKDFQDYNGPFMFAFDSSKLLNDSHLEGLLQMISKLYLHLPKYNEDKVLEFIQAKLGESGLEAMRESVINAIVHRDYINNFIYTKIIFNEKKHSNRKSNQSRSMEKLNFGRLEKQFFSKEYNSKYY